MRASRFINLGLCICGLLAVFTITSCSTRNASFDGLANQGLVPVSADSPFVGANVYLAKEMEDSLYLYNFLRTRGSPRAIEIVGNSESSAELHLFYPGKQEVYRATPQRDPMTKAKEWIIRGPYSIDRSLLRTTAQLGSETTGVFEVFGRRESLGGGASPTAQVRVLEPAFVPTPFPTPKPRRRVAPKVPAAASGDSQGPAIVIQGTPINFDQQAILEASKTPKTSAPQAGQQPAQGLPTTEPRKAPLDEALKATVMGSPATSPTPKAAGVAH